MLTFLLENYKGDFNDVIKYIINDHNFVHYLYQYCKEKNINIDLHLEKDISKLIHFIKYWSDKSYKIVIENDYHFYRRVEMRDRIFFESDIYNGEIVNKFLLEKYFMETHCEQGKKVIEILKMSKIDIKKIMYFSIVKQGYKLYSEEYSKLVKSDKIIDGGIGGTYHQLKNGNSILCTTLSSGDHGDNKIKSIYLNKFFYNNRFKKCEIEDIYNDLDKSSLSDDDKYVVKKIKKPHRFLEPKEGEHVMLINEKPFGGEHSELLPYENFCEIIE